LTVFITGTGSAVPQRVVTNEELAAKLGLAAEQIFKSTGIRRRRWAQTGTLTSELASEALLQAIDDAELTPPDVEYLILGTMTPDRFIPGSASALQKKAGLGQIPCLDIRVACCNALYAMQLASALIKSGVANNVAVSLAEIQSVWLDLSPSSGAISMLFGDGASAYIVAAEGHRSSLEILDVLLGTDGAYVDDLCVRSPGTEFGTSIASDGAAQFEDYQAHMRGQSVILQAGRRMTSACQAVLQRNRLTIEDVRWIVPHQANANLLAQLGRSLGFPYDGIISVIEEFGNTSSASMGIALDTLRRSQRIQDGDYLLLPAFGAGFTWGAGLCRARQSTRE
jgi:3-oxoacyl-[acyl-carrier-protein] synthase-3